MTKADHSHLDHGNYHLDDEEPLDLDHQLVQEPSAPTWTEEEDYDAHDAPYGHGHRHTRHGGYRRYGGSRSGAFGIREGR